MLIARCSRWMDHVASGPLRRVFQNPKRLLQDFVEPGMTTLDVGCGSGYFSLGMASLVGEVGRVVAVDIQGDVVERLRKKASAAGLSGRIEARVCNEQSLEIKDLERQIDFALAFYVVHHAPSGPKLMTDVHRALKPGGRFLVVEPRHHASAEECAVIEAGAAELGFKVVDHPRLVRSWAVALVK